MKEHMVLPARTQPTGISSVTSLTKAMLVQPEGLKQEMIWSQLYRWAARTCCRWPCRSLDWHTQPARKSAQESGGRDSREGSYLTSSGKRTLAAMPGKIMMKRGRSLSQPAMTQAPLAWDMSLEARARCTITWPGHRLSNSWERQTGFDCCF